ncbi:MAG: hypothetical protein IT382_05950, partial [Deltaproteobacteria bacterium]|nr:hypothetical protein [Deltaproteobacteria bacterium]
MRRIDTTPSSLARSVVTAAVALGLAACPAPEDPFSEGNGPQAHPDEGEGEGEPGEGEGEGEPG